MNNKTSVILIIVVAGALALFLPWVFSHRSIDLGPLSFETKEVTYDRAGKDNRDTYLIEVMYPYFTDGFSDEVGQKINNTLTAQARTTGLAVKNDFEDQYSVADADNTYVPPEPLTYRAEYLVEANLEELPFVNVTLNGYQYTGGAHGLTVINTFIFDARDGDEVTLETLFAPDYIVPLSRLALGALKKIDPELTTFTFAEEGTLPDPNNFRAFTLKHDGLHMIFQNYQVAPYVVGEPEITLSYESLRDILAPKYKEVFQILD